METHNSTPEESTPEKSLCEEYDDVQIKSADTARDPVLVDEFEVDLKSGEGRVHSLPSECESGYDDTPSECDLIVGEADGETSNLSVHDTEDEGRGSTRVGATSNLDYIDEGRDSVETEYAADDSGEIHLKHDLNYVNDEAGGLEDAEDNSLSAVTELSSCADTETVTTRNDNDNDKVTAQKDNIKSELNVGTDKDARLPTGLDPGAYSSLPRRGKSSSTRAGQRHIPTTRSVELRAGKILAAYPPHSRPGSNTSRVPESSRYSARTTFNTSTKVNTTPSGLTKSESLHSRISASATLGRGSRNSSPVAAQRSPRARSASGRGSPTLNYSGRRHGTRSTLSSPGRRSTAASPAATLERGSPECRRSCAASPFSSYASLDRRASPLTSSGDRRGYTQYGGTLDRYSSSRSGGCADRRGTGTSTSFRKQNSPKHTTTSPSPVTNYSSLKRPPKPRMPSSCGSDSERLARSSSVSTISSLSSRSSGSRSKSFRELNQARVSEPEPFSCSRDCGLQWKQSQSLRSNSSTKPGGKGCKGKPLQLWEIQQTLGRGDFIEGVLNVDFSNGLENYIYAPIQLGRADGHFDRTSQHARRIQR